MAAELFARSGEVLYKGDPSYALELLLGCCKLDPGCIIHRQSLREVARQVRSTRTGSWFERLTNRRAHGRLRAARNAGDHRKVLEHGEELLTRWPDDNQAHLAMADAAQALGLPTLAVWLLEEAHKHVPGDAVVLRTLARLCEQNGWTDAASVVWQVFQRFNPGDIEAITRMEALSRDSGNQSPSVV
jgi:hypothetical protein